MLLQHLMNKERLSTCWIGLAFGLCFVIIWTISHELSGMQANRYHLHFQWESNIPFQWWAVPIYFSLDIAIPFFPLLFRNWKAAISPVATLLAQTMIAAPFFIFIPIQTSYQNNLDGGIWGEVLFNPLGIPNISTWNHAPSLHVAYVFTIAWILGKNARRSQMVLLNIWALLVSLSTMLVHEHHLICVITGFLLFFATTSTVYPYLKRKFES